MEKKEQYKTIALTKETKIALDTLKAGMQVSHDEVVKFLLESHKNNEVK